MAKNTTINPMLTVSDVAHLISVHTNTVRRWSNQGVLKTYYISSRGDRRFQKKDIYDFLRQKSKSVESTVHQGGAAHSTRR